jgi:signal transduction histidine kinase
MTLLAALNVLGPVLRWFSGGDDHPYHPLYQCMAQDRFWVTVTVALDLSVAIGYLLIAMHWWKNGRHLPASPAKRALSNIRNIFVFCGICGYLFIPVKMFWPAWRLYDVFLTVLLYFTWRYVLGARDLKVIYSEIGRKEKLTDELEKAREESKRKSYFLNAISHDLRTPLNALMLQASLAEVGLTSGETQTAAAAVAEIKISAKATAELLNAFLEYARLDWAVEKTKRTQFDLPSLLREVVNLVAPSANEKRLFIRSSAPDPLLVETDRSKVERILLNLGANAVKFTDQGGVRMEVERTGSSVEIHVIDSGIGIEPELKDRLFDEFFQLRNGERDRRKGFGLGLTISRRLARQLGGEVVVESSVGSGSRFTLTLPDVVREPLDDSGLAPLTAAPAQGTTKI